MLDPRAILEVVITPTIEKLQLDLGNQKTVAAALLLGTALTESHLDAIKQIKGPALGLFQMEPDTELDIIVNYVRFRPAMSAVISQLRAVWPVEQLAGNLYLAAALCRIKYHRAAEPLPSLDIPALGRYWKAHYNTPLGAGKLEDFVSRAGSVLTNLFGVST